MVNRTAGSYPSVARRISPGRRGSMTRPQTRPVRGCAATPGRPTGAASAPRHCSRPGRWPRVRAWCHRRAQSSSSPCRTPFLALAAATTSAGPFRRREAGQFLLFSCRVIRWKKKPWESSCSRNNLGIRGAAFPFVLQFLRLKMRFAGDSSRYSWQMHFLRYRHRSGAVV